MDVDLYVIPMKGPDIVLGIQWLQNLGKVTHDYVEQIMEFVLGDRKYVLKSDESLRMKRISLHHTRALLETDDVYGVYELYHVAAADVGHKGLQAVSVDEHPEITQLLERFATLFQVPTSLPPYRSIDHLIHLLPNTKPVNVRPYHYPHYQKGEMES